jgi:hypothetical protein
MRARDGVVAWRKRLVERADEFSSALASYQLAEQGGQVDRTDEAWRLQKALVEFLRGGSNGV